MCFRIVFVPTNKLNFNLAVPQMKAKEKAKCGLQQCKFQQTAGEVTVLKRSFCYSKLIIYKADLSPQKPIKPT